MKPKDAVEPCPTQYWISVDSEVWLRALTQAASHKGGCVVGAELTAQPLSRHSTQQYMQPLGKNFLERNQMLQP